MHSVQQGARRRSRLPRDLVEAGPGSVVSPMRFGAQWSSMKLFAGITAVICLGAGLVVALSVGGDNKSPALQGNALQEVTSNDINDDVNDSGSGGVTASDDDFDDTIRVDTELPEPHVESEPNVLDVDVTVVVEAPEEVLNGYVPIGEDCSLSLDPIRELLVKRDANMLIAQEVVTLQALLNEASGVVCSGDEWVTFQENELVLAMSGVNVDLSQPHNCTGSGDDALKRYRCDVA